jgi:hypothetical protein
MFQLAALIGLLALGALGAFAALVLFTANTVRRVNAALPPPGHFVEVSPEGGKEVSNGGGVI